VSIGRVAAAESLTYIRDAKRILEAWQKRSESTAVPPAIAICWKTAAASYASFERVYPIYASRQHELSITLEGMGEAMHFVLRQKSDGRIVPVK